MLKEGDVIHIREGHNIYADIPEHFVSSNRRGCFDLTHRKVTVGGELSYLIGTYIVIKTTMNGGGTGHGSNDVYSDGHHVYCVKADNDDIRIDFYQSGSFTAMITDIEPVAEAKLTWTIEQEK